MDSLKLPTTAAQAKVFTGPDSLLFPKGIDGERDDGEESKLQQTAGGLLLLQTEGDVKIKKEPSDVIEPKQEDDDGATSGIVPTLQNIVATVNLDCRLDLKQLHCMLEMLNITQKDLQQLS